MEGSPRVISYSRWLQYVHYLYPGLRLSRSQEDLCDSCVHIDTLLASDSTPESVKEELRQQKKMHLDATVTQRRTMQTFIKTFVKKLDPNQVLPNTIIPDYIEEDQPTEGDSTSLSSLANKVTLQAEDFGGSLAMPHHGFAGPSVDYYNSNLILHNFVQADVSCGINYIRYYDERAQDKGADALCSMRLLYHLRDIKQDNPPSVSISILDNCVGQNKSNCVLKFAAFLSLCFYQKMVLLYLIFGHSHMIADIVVAWTKGAIRKRNLFTPGKIVQEVKKVKSVIPTFLDHCDPSAPFFIGWEGIINKCFLNLPSGFTFNYFFEFENGNVSMRHLCSTPDE
jgi:hypothetical protein